MSWANGTNAQGLDIGYAVKDTCNWKKCRARIDRGLAYTCGDMHDGGEFGCGKYFCYTHLIFTTNKSDDVSPQLCKSCARKFEELP